jgi:hypothetical protein
MSRNNGALPYFLDNPCALIIGGKFPGSAPVVSLPCYGAGARLRGWTRFAQIEDG